MLNTTTLTGLKTKAIRKAGLLKASLKKPVVLDTKKLIELNIKNIHNGYDYPNDWALTDEEFKNVMAVINSQFDFERGDYDSLEDIIDCGLRIDSKTGEVFYEGHQIDATNKTYYYKAESDALDKLKELLGKEFSKFKGLGADFEYFCKRWDEFEPIEEHLIIKCCRYTSVL